MSLKVAIAGCGKIADGHVEEIQKMPTAARVVAVCDLELLMAEQIAVRYGIPRHYDSFDLMLERERPDVVHITTPPQSHVPLAMKAIDAGSHVFVEKPLAPTHADAKRLVDHAVAAGRKLSIGYTYLHDLPARAMREIIASGAIGEPVHVESHYGFDLTEQQVILGDPDHWVQRLRGKLVHNHLDHILNKMVEFIDDDAPRVTAFGAVRRKQRYGDARDKLVDELRIVIQGERTTGYATFSSSARPVSQLLRVYGTKNTLHVDFTNRIVTLDPFPKLPSAIGRLFPAFTQAKRLLGQGLRNVVQFARSEFHYFAGLNEIIARFYECIAKDGPPPIAYRDMLRISAMMDDVFRQVDQGDPR